MQRTPKQGRKLKLSGKHDVNIRKKSEAASTPKAPEHVDSPPWMGESPSCDSAPSPIPFLCTQDGSNGETDVVWNYYSPSSEKEDTPIRKRKKKFTYTDFSPVTRLPMKNKPMRPTLRKKEFLKELKDELFTLNKNLQVIISSDSGSNTAPSNSNNDSPIDSVPFNFGNISFEDVTEPAKPPPTVLPLKKNIFSKINKCDDGALESDDSMNEFLLKASQLAEEEQMEKKDLKICDYLVNNKSSGKLKNDPINKVGSPKINNDSFENLICNLNDSEIETLTQAAPKKTSDKGADVLLKKCDNKSKSSHVKNIEKEKCEDECKKNSWYDDEDSFMNNISSLMNSSILNESRSKFGRHNSMPESPGRNRRTRGSTANSSFSRHNTMPSVGGNRVASEGLSQVMKCTPEEIKKKHQAAREKLLARKQEPVFKKNIPRTLTSNSLLHNMPQKTISSTIVNNTSKANHSIVNIKFGNDVKENNKKDSKYKFCNMNNNKITSLSKNVENKTVINKVNIQEEIERKRKEALQKLQMKKALNLQRK